MSQNPYEPPQSGDVPAPNRREPGRSPLVGLVVGTVIISIVLAAFLISPWALLFAIVVVFVFSWIGNRRSQ